MTRNSQPNNTVQAVSTSFAILDELRTGGEATLSELAEELGLAKSTVHRHLRTLHELDCVVHENNRFKLGMQLLALGEAARTTDAAYSVVEEKVGELARTTGERAQFVVEEHGDGVCIFRSLGERAVETSPYVGTRMPLHAIAAGKAILAFLPESRVQTIVDSELESSTERTIVDPAALREELATIRDEGFALNRGEHISGLKAVGAPIRRSDGSVLGAISISGPARRLDEPDVERSLRARLLGTTNELELNIASR